MGRHIILCVCNVPNHMTITRMLSCAQIIVAKVPYVVKQWSFSVAVTMSSAEASPSFSTTTMENARKAKVSMEQFYENLLIQDRDRTNRWRKLELSMEEMALVEEEVRTQGGQGA